MSRYEFDSLVVSVLGLLISTIVLVLLLMQLRLLGRQVEDARTALQFSTTEAEAENARRRQQATMEFIAGTIAKLEHTYDSIPSTGSRHVDTFLEKASTRDSVEFRALRNYLNYFEDVSVGVNVELFDLDIVDRTLGPRIVRTWTLYRDWILRERAAISAPRLWCDLEACAATIVALRESTDAKNA